MSGKKQDIITFKVDESLAKAMQHIPNRSEFIRTAILSALDNTCPLCMGTGILDQDQQKHWNRFAQTHALTRCDDCNAVHIECSANYHKHRKTKTSKV